jgi:tetraacyldisaccharide 4'-kinase
MFRIIASRIYGAAVNARNTAYDAGWLRSVRLPVPVISVGNITAGGTGKTPVVERLVEYTLGRGLPTAVVSRGYKRDSRGSIVVSDGKGRIVDVAAGGDEPVQIARKFPDAVVLADAKRSRGCRRAVVEFGVAVIILDDAYQHRAVHRNADIVVLDASSGLYAQKLLPAGRLREPLRNLSRADVLLLSRCDADVAHEQMALALRAYSNVPVFATRFVPTVLRRLNDGGQRAHDAFRGSGVVSFCGIGAPASFLRTMDLMGVASLVHHEFPDHHRFSDEDIAMLCRSAREVQAQLFTTEKDAMRLLHHQNALEGLEVWYPVMRLEFLGGEQAFFRLIEQRTELLP